jgi:hypothetical protein
MLWIGVDKTVQTAWNRPTRVIMFGRVRSSRLERVQLALLCGLGNIIGSAAGV